MSIEDMTSETRDVDTWICQTTQELFDHPERWPEKRETSVTGEPYWMGLEVRNFIHRDGGIVWCFDVFAHRGPDSQTEMSMNMEDGTKKGILDFMRDQLEKGCPKAKSYGASLWRKLDEKGDDDPFDDDYWW